MELDENLQADNVPLEDLHHMTLKRMVEDKGGTYTSKSMAIAWLRGEAPVQIAPKPAVAFDRSRKYGEIFGEVAGKPGARYKQDGVYFDADFRVI